MAGATEVGQNTRSRFRSGTQKRSPRSKSPGKAVREASVSMQWLLREWARVMPRTRDSYGQRCRKFRRLDCGQLETTPLKYIRWGVQASITTWLLFYLSKL